MLENFPLNYTVHKKWSITFLLLLSKIFQILNNQDHKNLVSIKERNKMCTDR